MVEKVVSVTLCIYSLWFFQHPPHPLLQIYHTFLPPWLYHASYLCSCFSTRTLGTLYTKEKDRVMESVTYIKKKRERENNSRRLMSLGDDNRGLVVTRKINNNLFLSINFNYKICLNFCQCKNQWSSLRKGLTVVFCKVTQQHFHFLSPSCVKKLSVMLCRNTYSVWICLSPTAHTGGI